MKKHLLLSALALIMYIGSKAQQPILRAEAYYSNQQSPNSYYLRDSIDFLYSNGRNSIANRQSTGYYGDRNYRYDTAYIMRNTNATTLRKFALLVQTFTNDSIDLMYDYSYDVISQVYKPVGRRRHYYNANHLLDSMFQDNYSTASMTWTNNSRTEYTYDGNGDMTMIVYSRWAGTIPAWHYSGIVSYWHNNNHNVIQSKTKHYNYNTFVLEDSIFHRYTYDGTGMVLLNDTTFSKDSLADIVTGYTYNSSGFKIMDSTYDYINSTLGWAYQGKKEYTYDASGNNIQVTTVSWDKANSIYYETQKAYYTYNSFNQLIKNDGEVWNNNGWNKDGSYRFLYYDIPNSVEQFSTEQQKMALYPIPATTYTNLEMNFDKPTGFSVIISDMQGRMVKQFTDKVDGQYKKNINVQDMPAGQYILQLKTNSETISKNFTVIR